MRVPLKKFHDYSPKIIDFFMMFIVWTSCIFFGSHFLFKRCYRGRHIHLENSKFQGSALHRYNLELTILFRIIIYKITHGRTNFKGCKGALVRLGQQRIHWRRISTVLTGGPHQKAPSLHSIMLACAISNFQSLHFRGNLDTRSECNFHNPNACAQAQWIFITYFFLLFIVQNWPF